MNTTICQVGVYTQTNCLRTFKNLLYPRQNQNNRTISENYGGHWFGAGSSGARAFLRNESFTRPFCGGCFNFVLSTRVLLTNNGKSNAIRRRLFNEVTERRQRFVPLLLSLRTHTCPPANWNRRECADLYASSCVSRTYITCFR